MPNFQYVTSFRCSLSLHTTMARTFVLWFSLLLFSHFCAPVRSAVTLFQKNFRPTRNVAVSSVSGSCGADPLDSTRDLQSAALTARSGKESAQATSSYSAGPGNIDLAVPKSMHMDRTRPISPYLIQPLPQAPKKMDLSSVGTMLRDLEKYMGTDKKSRSSVLYVSGYYDFPRINTLSKERGLRPFHELMSHFPSHRAFELQGGKLMIAEKYRVRQNIFCLALARYVTDHVHVMVGKKDPLYAWNTWNAYSRPLLQRRGINIKWVDTDFRPHEPVYPPWIIPPQQYGPPDPEIDGDATEFGAQGVESTSEQKGKRRGKGTGKSKGGKARDRRNLRRRGLEPTGLETHLKRARRWRSIRDPPDTKSQEPPPLQMPKGKLWSVTSINLPPTYNKEDVQRPTMSVSPFELFPWIPDKQSKLNVPSSDKMFVDSMRKNRHNMELRSHLIFHCGQGLSANEYESMSPRLYLWNELFGTQYDNYARAGNPYFSVVLIRLGMAAARLAEGQAYVRITSDEEARERDDLWNGYVRPILQKRNIRIVWLDRELRPRDPIYPPEIIPPEIYEAKKAAKGLKDQSQKGGNRRQQRGKGRQRRSIGTKFERKLDFAAFNSQQGPLGRRAQIRGIDAIPPKGTRHLQRTALQRRARRSPYEISSDFPAASPGLSKSPSVSTIYDKLTSTFGPKANLRENIIFYAGVVPQTLIRVAEDAGLYPWPHVVLESGDYDSVTRLANGYIRRDSQTEPFFTRAGIAAAFYAEKQAFVVLKSGRDGRKLSNAWNSFQRPILQSRGIKIVWLDPRGKQRRAVYPFNVISPEHYRGVKEQHEMDLA